MQPGQPLYLIFFSIAGQCFFFYTAVVFNPKDTADNLKRSGAFIPGIRPGEQTAKYIDLVMTRLDSLVQYTLPWFLCFHSFNISSECSFLFWWYFPADYCCSGDGFYCASPSAIDVVQYESLLKSLG